MNEVEKVDPGKGYRLLEHGEVLREGDEFLGSTEWWPSNGHLRPHRVGDSGYTEIYRRKIEVDTSARRKIYIAGPMRGIESYNFPAFDSAAEKLYNEGWQPINPADIDRDKGFDPDDLPADWDWNQLPKALDLRDIARRDIMALSECDAIYLLPGWEFSKGSLAEVHFAKWLGLEIIWPKHETETEYVPVTTEGQEDILEEALRITRGDRQAQYGPPDQDFRRTAGIWTSLFGHLLKDGAAFEPMHVALAMIGLKLSRQMHQRKRDNWTDIAGYARCGSICDEVA